MCTCIETLITDLRRTTGDPNVVLDTTTFGQFSNSYKTINIRYLYHPTMRNGKLAMQKKTKRVKPDYCPFCGVRYEQAEDQMYLFLNV